LKLLSNKAKMKKLIQLASFSLLFLLLVIQCQQEPPKPGTAEFIEAATNAIEIGYLMVEIIKKIGIVH